MKLRLNGVTLALAVTALALGQGAWTDEAAAKKWIDAEFSPRPCRKISRPPRCSGSSTLRRSSRPRA